MQFVSPLFKWLKMKPSNRLAYILGVLCSDGYVSKHGYRIALTVKDKSFAKKFKSFFTDEFKISGSLFHRRNSKKEHSNVYDVNFYSKEVHEKLTYKDYRFKGEDWHILIQCKYEWVLGDEYFYSFLNGFFDGDGSICDPDAQYRLRLHIGYTVPFFWLKDILQQKGFNFRACYRTDVGDGDIVVKELLLNNIEDIIRLSKKIKSSIHRKESRLIRYRNAKFICPKYCEDIEESFRIVKRYRLMTGFGSLKLMKIPEVAELNIPQSTIRNWIRRDTVPTLKYNSRNKDIYWNI